MPRLLDLWHQLQAWLPIIGDYSAAIGLVAAALGVASIAPGIRTRLVAAIFACAVVTTTVAYSVGLKRGSDRVKADWDWTLEVEARDGEGARADAVRAVRVEPRDSGVLRSDPWNRDTFAAPGR